MRYLSIIVLASFLAGIAFFPAHGTMTRSAEQAKMIFSRLYRNVSSSEIEDFTASFSVKVNESPQYIVTTHEDDLVPFSRGRLFFKKPYNLRVETSILYPPGLEGADFVEIRNGKYVYAFKNGLDLPIGMGLDDPTQPSTYLPFGMQIPFHPQDLEITLLGQRNSRGVKTYILGLLDRTDPDHDILKVWIDADHYFVRQAEWFALRNKKSSMQINSDSGPISIYKDAVIKVTTLYKDPLQLPNGYWIPMRMERYENWKEKSKGLGSLAQVVVYSKVSVNDHLADALFRVPNYNIPFQKYMGENR